MRQPLALFRPKSGDKATPYHWVRFSYRGHVYRHSTFTRNDTAARRRATVWRQRVIEFVDRTGRIPRESEVPMPTSPEETPELVTIIADGGRFTMRIGAAQAKIAASLARLEQAVRTGDDPAALALIASLRQLLFEPQALDSNLQHG